MFNVEIKNNKPIKQYSVSSKKVRQYSFQNTGGLSKKYFSINDKTYLELKSGLKLLVLLVQMHLGLEAGDVLLQTRPPGNQPCCVLLLILNELLPPSLSAWCARSRL